MREQTITAAYRRLARSRRVARAAVGGRNIQNALLAQPLAHGIEAERNRDAPLANPALADDRLVFDVGAHVGDWTGAARAAAPALERVVAYEPTRAGAEQLRGRFSGEPRVEIVEAAVSDSAGEMTFYEEPGVGEGSSLLAGHSRPDAVESRVAVVTVDDELERLGSERIDFLKIDAEGFDLHVLRGAAGALERHAVGVIQFEYNEPWLQALALLSGHGYETFLLKASGLHPYDMPTYGELFAYANFVAFAPGRSAAFAQMVRPPL